MNGLKNNSTDDKKKNLKQKVMMHYLKNWVEDQMLVIF